MLLLVSGDNRLAAEKVGYVNGVAYAPIGCLLPAKRRPTPYAVKSWSVARPDAAFCCSLADGSYGLEGTYCTIIGFWTLCLPRTPSYYVQKVFADCHLDSMVPSSRFSNLQPSTTLKGGSPKVL